MLILLLICGTEIKNIKKRCISCFDREGGDSFSQSLTKREDFNTEMK